MKKLTPPAWCSNAIPTPRGWEDPATGELYVSGGFSIQQLEEHNMCINAELAGATVLTEAPVGNTSLDEMNKIELEALGRQYGVELDRRHGKEALIEEVEQAIDLSKLTKIELEKLGREHGVEIDRRLSKAKLVAQLADIV
jgi:hypothetical protein